MELYREYFPTKAYKFAKMKMGTLLGAELDRLDGIAKSLGREYAVGPDNLASQIQKIREFTTKYHEAFSQYLGAVLVQHDKPVQCRPPAATAATTIRCRSSRSNCWTSIATSAKGKTCCPSWNRARCAHRFSANITKAAWLRVPVTTTRKNRRSTTTLRNGSRARFRTAWGTAAFTLSGPCLAACTLARRTRAIALRSIC